MSKRSVPAGSVFEIQLPDGRFAYGCWYEDFIVGIYDIISKEHADFMKVRNLPFKAFKGCNDTAIKKKKWPIIGSIELTGDSTYSPDLALYLTWAIEESVEKSEVNRNDIRTHVSKAYYLTLVKKGYTYGIFNKPEMLAEWIAEHLENWPDYEMPHDLK